MSRPHVVLPVLWEGSREVVQLLIPQSSVRMAETASAAARKSRDEELSFLRKEEQYLLSLISAVDKKIIGLGHESMIMTREMPEYTLPSVLLTH